MRFYSQEKETLKLKDLHDRLVQVASIWETNIRPSTSTGIETDNASLFDIRAVRKYELRDEIYKEGRIIKSNKNNNDIIYNIQNSQIAGLFWFADRTETLLKGLNTHIERYLEFQGNKRFLLSYSDPDIDKIHEERGYQYLLSVSDTLSLDFCSRKLIVVKKPFTQLGTTQKFASLRGDYMLSISRIATNRSPMSKKVGASYDKTKEDTCSILATNMNRRSDDHIDTNPSSKQQSNLKLPGIEKFTSLESVSSQASEENRGKQNRGHLLKDPNREDFESKNKSNEGDDDREKHFEYVFDILGHYLGIDDSISTGCNVGMVVKDWSYPVDCICLIGNRGIYIKTNFMIQYEKETKTLINLIGRPESRNYNLGKFYMEIEDMTKPYQQDNLTKNKFRKMQGDLMDKMYFIRYKDIMEIHSKHYMGKRVIGLEFWTLQRRPRLFIFNINDVSSIWPLIIEKWIRYTNDNPANIAEIKKEMNFPLCDRVSFWLKTMKDGNPYSKPVVELLSDQSLIKKVRPRWEQGYLDNFNYLMMLNACAGRSLKFMSCYYVFPQIISNFGLYLDKQDGAMRDLSKPMATLKFTKPEDIQFLRDKYKDENFHHGNFYSNKNILEHYLFRVMPYTQYQFDLNDGRLDDRMFFDFDTNFKNCSGNGSNFEMIPENYYLDYYLLNINNLDFKNEKYDNVILPEWANCNPRFFNLKMRQALESPFVNKRLGKWIDLIFGVAQQGKKAEESLNAYMEGCSTIVDPSKFPTASATSQLETNKVSRQLNSQINMMYNMGQTPSIIFTEEHPEKRVMFDPDRTSVLSALQLNLHTSSQANVVRIPLNEWLAPVKSRMENFSHIIISEDKERAFGPISNLLRKLKGIKQRYFKLI